MLIELFSLGVTAEALYGRISTGTSMSWWLSSVFYMIRVLPTWLPDFPNGFNVSGRWPTFESESMPIDVCLRPNSCIFGILVSSTVIFRRLCFRPRLCAVFRWWYIAVASSCLVIWSSSSSTKRLSWRLVRELQGHVTK